MAPLTEDIQGVKSLLPQAEQTFGWVSQCSLLEVDSQREREGLNELFVVLRAPKRSSDLSVQL